MAHITITILEEISSNRFLLECRRCNGTGRYINNSRYECDTCKGRGTLLVEINGNLPFVQCGRCNGKGRYINNSRYVCDSCQGSGAQPASGTMTILT